MNSRVRLQAVKARMRLQSNRLSIPMLAFLLLGQLVFGLPVLLMLCMAGLGLYFAQVLLCIAWRDHLFRQKFLLLSVCFTSIFWIKLSSLLWAAHPFSALSNAFNHVHFLVWPLLLIYFWRLKLSMRTAVLPLTAGLLLVAIWGALSYWGTGNTCFAAGVHNCGLLVQTLGISIIFLLWVLLWNGMHAGQTIIALVGLFAALLTLWITQRRTEWIVLTMCLPLYGWLHFKELRTRWKSFVRFALLFIAVAVGIIWSQPRFNEIFPAILKHANFTQRTLENDGLNSIDERIEQYRIAVLGIADRPILGWGAGIKPRHLSQYATDQATVMPYSHFHSQFLQHVLEVGVLGLLVACACVLYIFRWLILAPLRTKHRVFALLLGILIAYHGFRGLANSSFGYSPINTFFVVWSAWITSWIWRPVGLPSVDVTK